MKKSRDRDGAEEPDMAAARAAGTGLFSDPDTWETVKGAVVVYDPRERVSVNAAPRGISDEADVEQDRGDVSRAALPKSEVMALTFGEFAYEARRHKFTAKDIAKLMPVGALEDDPKSDYAQRLALGERILSGKHRPGNEWIDLSETVIPYRSLIAQYDEWTSTLRVCPGCNELLPPGRADRRFCSDRCRKRVDRAEKEWAEESARRQALAKTRSQAGG